MFSLSKFNLGYKGDIWSLWVDTELGYKGDIWSLWVDTELGAIPVKVGTFRECWEERMNRYNRETSIYL